MKVKPKICKSCQKPFVPFNSLTPVCSASCALKFNSKKEIQKRIKEMKTSLRKLSDYEDLAKKIFQKFIRLRDAGKPCISCGATVQNGHASHYFSAGQFSGLIFDEQNVHLSCVQCNTFLHGNLLSYRLGLINRIGESALNELELRSINKRNYKYSKEELVEITNYYKAKLKND